MNTFQKATAILLALLIIIEITKAQDYQESTTTAKMSRKDSDAGRILAETDILYSFNLRLDRDPLGVTIVDNTVIISSAGETQNYFDTYSLDGTYLTTFDQATVSEWGYRDLAFDGAYILASDGNNIQKIDPVNFNIAATIFNDSHSHHRGLAYDPVEDVIYSTNYRSGQLTKIDPATGATISENGRPEENVYGIAYDNYSNANAPALWFAEPTSRGVFRISRVDKNTAKINYTFDVTNKLADPDSALSGGLEVINDHPDYPDKVIAVAVEQHTSTLLFIDITDAPNPLPVELEEVGEFGGFDDEGIITSGMAVYNEYLYCVNNNDVSIYEISGDPTNPFFIKSLGLADINKIFIYDDHLYLTNGANFNATIVSIFTLIDPVNPQFLSSFDTQDKIRKIILHNNFLIISKTNANNIDVLDVSVKTQPLLAVTHPLPADATGLASDTDRNILFAGYYGGGINAGVKVLDISDINNITELDDLVVFGDAPQSMFILNNHFYLLRSWRNFDATSLGVYDYSNAADVDRLAFKFLSLDNGGWQIKNIGDYIVATLPNEGMFTYYYDEQANEILSGPSVQLAEPREIVAYNYLIPPGKQNSVMNEPQQVTYTYTTNGHATQDKLDGSKRNKIVKQKQPPPPLPPIPGDARLTMGIEPPEAEQEGCATDPTGTNDYPLNTSVGLTAIPNTDEGWNFTQWTGDVTGEDPNANIIMDEDKEVTAHFIKPELNVITTGPARKVFCPDEAHNKSLKIIDLALTANEIDDWILSSLKFTNLINKKSIAAVKLSTPTGIITGVINPDTTEFIFTINPGIVIPKSSTITVSLYFDIDLPEPDQICEMDEIREYRVTVLNGNHVVVNPLTYTYGKKTVATPLNSKRTFIACVSNSANYGFETIQSAVLDETTLEGDECLVCKGEYTGGIIVNKPLSIISKAGREHTTLTNGSIYVKYIMKIESNDVTVKGFQFHYSSFGTLLENGCLLIKRELFDNPVAIRIEECQFRYSNDLEIYGIESYSDNSFFNNNIFLIPNYMIGKNNEMQNNTFLNEGTNIVSGNKFNVRNNKFYSNSDITFQSSDSEFSDNDALGGGLLRLSEIEASSVFGNDGFNITLKKTARKNKLYANSANQIFLVRCSDNHIYENTFENSDGSAIVFNMSPDSYDAPVDELATTGNVIENNTIRSAGNYGIEVNYSYKDSIRNNKIYKSSSSGILVKNSNSVVVKKNYVSQSGVHGIFVQGSKSIKISDNTSRKHDKGGTFSNITAGITVFNSEGGYVASNNLYHNCKAVYVDESSTIRVGLNNCNDSFCLNTGIQINDSDCEIFGNNVSNNNGNGIVINGNSAAIIYSNNIRGNTGYGISNSSDAAIVYASNNFWGDESGPGEQSIEGNVIANSWLNEPVSLLSSFESDTVFISPGEKDSITVNFMNLSNLTDKIDISVIGTNEWIINGNTLNVQHGDSIGSSAQLVIAVPPDVGASQISMVICKGISSVDNSLSVDDTLYISSYQSSISSFSILPDSATIFQGDSLLLSYLCLDQHENNLEIDLSWTSSAGLISSAGMFKSDSTTGEITITAVNSEHGISAKAAIYVTTDTLHLDHITINPDSVHINPGEILQFTCKGYNRYNYPVNFIKIWNAAGGYINNEGLFEADSVPGNYNVTVTDHTGNIFAEALIVISDVTSIENYPKIPQDYSVTYNYPNPFNPSTTIQYGVPFESKVTIEVFNILGQRAATLVNEIREAGVYKIMWNAEGYASGLYLLRIQATSLESDSDFTQVMKMILMK